MTLLQIQTALLEKRFISIANRASWQNKVWNPPRAPYQKLENDLKKLATGLELPHVEVVPVSATEGDNITTPSPNMLWYRRKPLLEYLETVEVDTFAREQGFVMPVQRVCRPDHTFRGFQGEISSGSVSVGDEISVLPSGGAARVQSILRLDKSVSRADAGEPVTEQ